MNGDDIVIIRSIIGEFDLSDEQWQVLERAIKALKQQPNRCDSCIHSEEQDGSNCYECVKGMADNFETQQTDVDCISRKDAIKHFEDNIIEVWSKEEIADELKYELPSVTPSYNGIKTELEHSCDVCKHQDNEYLCDHCMWTYDDKFEREVEADG